MNPLKAVVLALALAAAQPVLADSSPDVQRARALLEAGKSDEAAAALEQAIARNQSDVEALVMLSELYAYSEMYDEALAQAQAAVAVAPKDSSALYARGRAWMLKEDNAKAKADFDAVLAQGPDGPALVDRGHVKGKMGDDKGAIADFEAAARLRPDWLPPLLNLTVQHFYQERYEESLVFNDRSLALDPHHYGALGLRAAMLSLLGRTEEAVTVSEHLVREYPKDLEAQLQLGRSYEAAGRTEDALKAYTAAIKIDGQSAEAWIGRGRALASKDEYKAALRDFDRAILIDPANAELLADRARARAATGDDRARADFDTALKIDPVSAYALIRRGYYNLDQEDYDGALNDFDAALKIDSTDLSALLGRVSALLYQERFDRALRDVNRAIELSPVAMMHRLKGSIYAGMEDHLQAIASFDEAIRLDPADAEAWLYRSESKAALGDTAGAASDRAQALRLNPRIEAELAA